jgi:phosphonate transport system ATP-binding protein
MISQQFTLVQRLDVLTNVLVGRLNHRSTLSSLFKLFSAEERALAIHTPDRFDLAKAARQRADALSGGQQQRATIARALMQQPRIILADEPIASRDPRNGQVVTDAARRINREDGLTVLCTPPTLAIAPQDCDRIVGMRAARVVFDGTPAQLTPAIVRDIYGMTEEELDQAETVTSSAIETATSRLASLGALSNALRGRLCLVSER